MSFSPMSLVSKNEKIQTSLIHSHSKKAKKLVADAGNDLGVDFSVEIGPGDFLGEAGLFEDAIKRNATCTAITDVSTRCIYSKDWIRLLRHFPDEAMKGKLYRMKQARTYGLTSLLLKNSSLTHLTNAQLWLLAGLSETIPFSKDEIICKAGSVPTHVYIVKSGLLKAHVSHRRTHGLAQNADLALNHQRALRDEAELSEGMEFGKGAWVGDVQALMKGQPTNLEITASREGWVFALNAHNLGAYVHRYPGLFMTIYDRLFLI